MVEAISLEGKVVQVGMDWKNHMIMLTIENEEGQHQAPVFGYYSSFPLGKEVNYATTLEKGLIHIEVIGPDYSIKTSRSQEKYDETMAAFQPETAFMV